jgi:hypothetical protein
MPRKGLGGPCTASGRRGRPSGFLATTAAVDELYSWLLDGCRVFSTALRMLWTDVLAVLDLYWKNAAVPRILAVL